MITQHTSASSPTFSQNIPFFACLNILSSIFNLCRFYSVSDNFLQYFVYLKIFPIMVFFQFYLEKLMMINETSRHKPFDNSWSLLSVVFPEVVRSRYNHTYMLSFLEKVIESRVVWIDIMFAYWTYFALPNSFSAFIAYGQLKPHLLSYEGHFLVATPAFPDIHFRIGGTSDPLRF